MKSPRRPPCSRFSLRCAPPPGPCAVLRPRHGGGALAPVRPRPTQRLEARPQVGTPGDGLGVALQSRSIGYALCRGLALGIPAALASTRVVRASLFGVGPAGPLSVCAAIVVMLAGAVTGGFFPARRATRLDPLAALRNE